MAEGFCFMPLGLVRLRTFRLSDGLLRCNINTGVLARARSGRVTQRCHNSPDGKRGLQSAGDVSLQKRAENLGDLEES